MKEIDKAIEALSDIKNPMSRESVDMLYAANNVYFERCELYSDYTQSLLILIFDTYLGDDFTDSTQQINHFKWCWDKNNENFAKEGVIINSDRLYDYFLEFMLELYYPLSNKGANDKSNSNIIKLWSYLLDYSSPKVKSDVDTMIEVYKLFEDALKKGKK